MLNEINSEIFKYFTKKDYPERLEKIKYRFTQEQYKNLTTMFESNDYNTLKLLKEIIIQYEQSDK